jgi:dihydrofolate reductase
VVSALKPDAPHTDDRMRLAQKRRTTFPARPPASNRRRASRTAVTDGIDSALAQARAVAGDKDAGIGGSANVIQQYLAARLVDELRLHLAPVLLGAGKRLFDHLGNQTIELQRTRVIESPYATHLFCTVRRWGFRTLRAAAGPGPYRPQ